MKIAKLQTLRKSFETFHMKDIEFVDHFMEYAMNTINQMHTHGEDVPDQKFIEKVLRVLPNNFDMVDIDIEKSKILAQFYIKELIGSLLNHEIKINRHSDSLRNAFESQSSIGRGRGLGNRSR